ncbi:DUF2071 domain-containing protein [Neolewinella sp.]|uniref:DUF2071 domain-containing protein n=1 Tax=Neolewinella sp. TaxID=2993543 RepID=UPI003B516847
MLPLQDHPFPVRAHFASFLVVTFGVPVDRVRPLLPPCLTPDMFRDETAFIAAALVDTRHLRPAALPQLFGQDFFLIGYRVFVRYRNQAGRNLRGLYILRSETNRRRMQWLGNLFTHYGYTTTDIQQRQDGDRLLIRSLRSDLDVRVDTSEENPPLPPDSCFANWKEARRFAGPLPFTFTYKPASSKVLIVEGVRQNWTPRPVRLLDQHFGFLDTLGLAGAPAVSVFRITNVPYYWRAGKTEPWQP